MKKLLALSFCFILVFTMVGCDTGSNTDTGAGENAGTNVESKHEGYFVKYDYQDADVSITNYDPDQDTDSYPKYQELIQYGKCGIMSDDVIYYIFIVDGEDKYCSFEIDADTMEIIYEENTLFDDDATKNAKKDALIAMIKEYIK